MNEPRLPAAWERLRVPTPPPDLRARLLGEPVPALARRPRSPVWPLLWAAAMAGLVAVNLWLEARHRQPAPTHPPTSLAELRRGLDPSLLEWF